MSDKCVRMRQVYQYRKVKEGLTFLFLFLLFFIYQEGFLLLFCIHHEAYFVHKRESFITSLLSAFRHRCGRRPSTTNPPADHNFSTSPLLCFYLSSGSRAETLREDAIRRRREPADGATYLTNNDGKWKQCNFNSHAYLNTFLYKDSSKIQAD